MFLWKLSNWIFKNSDSHRIQDSTFLRKKCLEGDNFPCSPSSPPLNLAPESTLVPPPPTPHPCSTSCSPLCPSNHKEPITYGEFAFLAMKVLGVKIGSTYQWVPALGWGERWGGQAFSLKLGRLFYSSGCSSSSYLGTSCCCCHGDAPFHRRQGKGDGEGKRTDLAATVPDCKNCPFQKHNMELCFEYLVCKAGETQTSQLDTLFS